MAASCAWAISPSSARGKVNGVSALHGELMKQTVFRPLHRLFPDRITAITNGVTPRRWVLDSNPELADLITETLGTTRWIADLERLEELAPRATDPAFQTRFAAIKQANKERLADFVAKRHDVALPTDALFDVHIKRIHEYKRQLLNILEAVATYADMLDGRNAGSRAAGEDLRRQGGAVLHARQADHQVHQRRRRGGERASPRSASG